MEFPDLSDQEDGHSLILGMARESGAALVILDNLSTLATVEDENSAAAIRAPVALVQKLRQVGCAVLVVHHSDKGGKNYRGSSNFATTFSHIIGLTPSDGVTAGAMDVTMEWTKNRNGPSFAQAPMRVRLLSGEGEPRWDVGESESFQAARLARAIRSRQFESLIDAGKSIGLQKSRAYVVKDTMLATGLMTEQDLRACFKDAKDNQADVETVRDF